MWELDYKESWALKNWCFWAVVLEKTLESPLDCKEIQPVHPKGDQSWVFIGRTDVEAETPLLWPPDAKSWLIWKDSDAGIDWRQEKKGMAEDEMVEWRHQLGGHDWSDLAHKYWLYHIIIHVFVPLSVQFSCSVVSNSLWPHGLQHIRPPCPSPTPSIYSN